MTRNPSLFNYLHRTTPDLVQSDSYGKPAIRMDIFSRLLQYFMKFARFRCRFIFIANFSPLNSHLFHANFIIATNVSEFELRALRSISFFIIRIDFRF